MPELFLCRPFGRTPFPQTLVYEAMHNDYCEEFADFTQLSEEACGDLAVKRLLQGGRGHWGPLEHPAMTLKVQADHNTIMQLRAHRISSHDIQSSRYTGKRFLKVAEGELEVQEVFLIRPAGTYKDREGKAVSWTQDDVEEMEAICLASCIDYRDLRERGVPEEMARNALVTCYRQNDVITMNLRGWLHLLEVRVKPDAQWEFRQLAELMLQELRAWAPQIMSWWETHRANRSLLAP